MGVTRNDKIRNETSERQADGETIELVYRTHPEESAEERTWYIEETEERTTKRTRKEACRRHCNVLHWERARRRTGRH